MKVLNKKKSSVLAGQKPLKKGAQSRSSWFRALSRAILSLAALWVFAIFFKGFAAPRLEQWIPSIFDKSELEFFIEAKNLSEKRKNEIHDLLKKTISSGTRYEMDQAKHALVSMMAIEKLSLARTKKNRIDVKILARIPYVKVSEIDDAWATKEGVVFINHDVDQFDVKDLPVLTGAVQPRTGEEIKREAEVTVSSTEMHAITQALTLLSLVKSSRHGDKLENTQLSLEKHSLDSNPDSLEKNEGLNPPKKDSEQQKLEVSNNMTHKSMPDELKKNTLHSNKAAALNDFKGSSSQVWEVAEIHWNIYRGISFKTIDGTEVVIGQGPFEDKLRTLYKLFADGKTKEFSHIELDYRGKIFAKKRG